jgi:hypothetical protein
MKQRMSKTLLRPNLMTGKTVNINQTAAGLLLLIL